MNSKCTITGNATTKARATFCYSHVARCQRRTAGHRSAATSASAVFSSTTTERPHEFFDYTRSRNSRPIPMDRVRNRILRNMLSRLRRLAPGVTVMQPTQSPSITRYETLHDSELTAGGNFCGRHSDLREPLRAADGCSRRELELERLWGTRWFPFRFTALSSVSAS